MPVTNDPFAKDPFSMNAQQRLPVSSAAGFPTSNPFGSGGFPPQQLYGTPPRGMMPGAPGVPGAAGVPGFMGQPAFGQPASVGRAPNPFGMGFSQIPAAPQQGNLFGEPKEDSNLLQPMRKDDGSAQKEDTTDKAPKKLRDDLFGDLVDIKKSPGSSGDSPKDLFAKASTVEKKSMNALKAQVGTDSLFGSEPFGPSHFPEGDKTRGLLPSDTEDPFDTSHIPPTLSEPPSSAPPLQPHAVAEDTPPPVPKRPVMTVSKESTKALTSAAVLLSPHPSSHSSKQLNCSFSSSSSLSSTSSSTSPSLSSKSHHQPPSSKPPPLPKRTPADGASPSKACDISDVNTPPSSLALSILPPTGEADMLPSPDEPPPPLPKISYAPSAPPPPPRPNSSFPVSASQSSPSTSSSRGTDKVFTSASSSRQAIKNDFDMKFQTLDDVFSSETGQKPKLQPKRDAQSERDTNIVKHRDPSNSSPKIIPRDPTDPFSPSLSLRKTKNKPKALFNPFSPIGDKQVSDPFLPLPPSGQRKQPVSETFDSAAAGAVDPFMVPVHLTPGFKVEAKFGNDPFDDSFSEVLHGKPTESSWDPFAPDMNTSNNCVGVSWQDCTLVDGTSA